MIARGYRGPGSGNPMLLLSLVLLVLYFLSGSLQSPIQNAAQDPLGFVEFALAILLSITVHEFMHAYAATSLGDDTARSMGRLTLNPLAHFDIFGTLMIVLFRFGYGKPVPFNESRLRGAFGVAIVAAAGPLSNLALAALFAVPLRFGAAVSLGFEYQRFLLTVVGINCLLAIFNLLPIPPLDGSNVVYGLLPPRQQYSWRQFQAYGPIILIGLLFLGGRFLSTIVVAPAQGIETLLLGPGFFR
ncbi:MAG: site-2 protease family protein [Candidatus Limnocylindria bacterium]